MHMSTRVILSHAHICRGQRNMSGVLLCKMLPYCIETESVTERKVQSFNQVGWRTSSQHLPALPFYSSSAGVTGVRDHLKFFIQVLVIQNQVLMLAHLPTESSPTMFHLIKLYISGFKWHGHPGTYHPEQKQCLHNNLHVSFLWLPHIIIYDA